MGINYKGAKFQANYYFHRGNPEPIDDSLLYSELTTLQSEIDKGVTSTIYPGLLTSIINPDDPSQNGPYFIDAAKTPQRILLKSEFNTSYSYLLNAYSYLKEYDNKLTTSYNNLNSYVKQNISELNSFAVEKMQNELSKLYIWRGTADELPSTRYKNVLYIVTNTAPEGDEYNRK